MPDGVFHRIGPQRLQRLAYPQQTGHHPRAANRIFNRQHRRLAARTSLTIVLIGKNERRLQQVNQGGVIETVAARLQPAHHRRTTQRGGIRPADFIAHQNLFALGECAQAARGLTIQRHHGDIAFARSQPLLQGGERGTRFILDVARGIATQAIPGINLRGGLLRSRRVFGGRTTRSTSTIRRRVDPVTHPARGIGECGRHPHQGVHMLRLGRTRLIEHRNRGALGISRKKCPLAPRIATTADHI